MMAHAIVLQSKFSALNMKSNKNKIVKVNGLGLKRLLVNIASTLGRQVISGLLQLIALAVVAREFGPAGNGAYTLALLLPTMLATVLNMGVGPANIYFLGSNKVNPNKAWQVTLKICFWLTLLGWLIGMILILTKAPVVFPGVPTGMLWMSLLFFPLILVTQNMSSFFQGLQEFKNFNLVLLLQPIIFLVSIGTLLLIGYSDIFLILSCYFISLIITQFVAYKLLQQLLSVRSGPNVISYGKKMLNYGYKAHLSNILAFINYRADIFLLGYFMGPSAVGVYAVAVNITERLWIFSGSVSTVLLPRLSELSSDEDKRKILTPLIARWVLWITILASIILVIIGDFIVNLMFGDDFNEAYNAIVYLVPGVAVGACSRVLASDLAARGRPDLNLATAWITVIINIIGNVLLVPKYGLQGAAAATSFAYVINFIMRLVMHNCFTKIAFHKNLIVTPNDLSLLKSVFKKKAQKVN